MIWEVRSLADNIKQVLFQDYKTRYNERSEDIVVWLKIFLRRWWTSNASLEVIVKFLICILQLIYYILQLHII